MLENNFVNSKVTWRYIKKNYVFTIQKRYFQMFFFLNKLFIPLTKDQKANINCGTNEMLNFVYFTANKRNNQSSEQVYLHILTKTKFAENNKSRTKHIFY